MPEDLRQGLEAAAAPLRSVARAVSWVKTDNLHITLKFLGDIEDDRAGEIAASLAVAVADIDAFDIALRGLGAFPTPVRPRVIWAGVGAGAPALAATASAVERSLSPLGLPCDARGFTAHVTLGRVREPRRDPALTDALAGAAAAELGSARVDQVVLMRSQLLPRGARYTPLATLPLAGAPKKRASGIVDVDPLCGRPLE